MSLLFGPARPIMCATKLVSCEMTVKDNCNKVVAMLKNVLIISAVILFMSVAAPAPRSMPQEAASDTKNPAQPVSETLARARTIYARDCAMCHGDHGNGQTDTARDMKLSLGDWTDPRALADKTDKDMFLYIRDGKDKMPPEDDGRAKDDDVRNLIFYIRQFSKPQAVPVSRPAK